MSELSYVFELYFSNEDDEVAVENVQTGLDVEQARAVKAEWRRALARRDPKECLRLVSISAMRAPADDARRRGPGSTRDIATSGRISTSSRMSRSPRPSEIVFAAPRPD